MNKTILVGRVGKDPEVRYTKSNKAVATFSLATEDYYGGETHTEWHRIVCWDKTAEFIGKHVKKGHLVEVDGRNQMKEWEDNDGNKRQTTEVIANSVKPHFNQGSGGKPSDDVEDFEDEDLPL